MNQVEKQSKSSNTKSELDNAILITTYITSFIFAQIHDRDFVVEKISELLSRTQVTTHIKTHRQNSDTGSMHSTISSQSDDQQKPTETWKMQPPLMTKFPLENSAELNETQNKKEKIWIRHLEEYGHGVSIYRTHETAKLILQGVPDRLRGEIWLSLSGAANEMAMNPGLYRTLVEQSLGKFLT